MTQNYVCVHCGTSLKALYRKHCSILKLSECDNCSKTADKYIEYDIVIVLIDLILFNKEPYRHILFNTEFKSHWKFGLIIFLLKSFSQFLTGGNAQLGNNTHTFVTTEYMFYIPAVVTAAGGITYLTFLIAFITLKNYLKNRTIPTRRDILLIWKAAVLSNIGQFLLLPSLIWMELGRELHQGFVVTYSFIAQVQALSVVSGTSRRLLIGFLIISFLAELAVIRQCQFYFKTL